MNYDIERLPVTARARRPGGHGNGGGKPADAAHGAARDWRKKQTTAGWSGGNARRLEY
ncbi:hypothetical protein [Caballeronia sp. J97]|uniref:hypothetical protein n=1 Tax=Caballeronia sp. J97 TaxID=2805429 RepID=UPI002AB1CBF0|nr:hypothetical protein [Caballeronia sp. J97]